LHVQEYVCYHADIITYTYADKYMLTILLQLYKQMLTNLWWL